MARRITGFRIIGSGEPEEGRGDLVFCADCAGAYQMDDGSWTDEYANNVAPVYFTLSRCAGDCAEYDA